MAPSRDAAIPGARSSARPLRLDCQGSLRPYVRMRREMVMTTLDETALAIVADGKGVLAADETVSTIGKRFAAHAIESTADSRRAYREMLFSTPDISQFIGGVILQDETIRQNALDRNAPGRARRQPGHDPRHQGRRRRASRSPGSPGELVTEGLDGLRDRLEDVPADRRALREVARGDPHRPGATDHVPASPERGRARALRGALPGAGPGPDRRARGADGRRAQHRPLCRGDRSACCSAVFDALFDAAGRAWRRCCSSRTW